MIRNVVMMGGSFNPPTIAHFKLLQAAVSMLEDSIGIFVPSSHANVMKKMDKAGGRIVCFS